MRTQWSESSLHLWRVIINGGKLGKQVGGWTEEELGSGAELRGVSREQARNQGGANPLRKHFAPPEKYVGHSFKNSGSSQKTLCPLLASQAGYGPVQETYSLRNILIFVDFMWPLCIFVTKNHFLPPEFSSSCDAARICELHVLVTSSTFNCLLSFCGFCLFFIQLVIFLNEHSLPWQRFRRAQNFEVSFFSALEMFANHAIKLLTAWNDLSFLWYSESSFTKAGLWEKLLREQLLCPRLALIASFLVLRAKIRCHLFWSCWTSSCRLK